MIPSFIQMIIRLKKAGLTQKGCDLIHFDMEELDEGLKRIQHHSYQLKE